MVLVTCALYAWTRQVPLKSPRVYNGVDVKKGLFKYVVALLVLERRMCTGTLLASNWVLTAAHCQADSIQYGNMTIRPTKVTAVSRLLKRIPHPSYSCIRHSDLAMLLVEKVPLQNFPKLSALDYRTVFGLYVEWVGGGLTSWDWNASQVLQDYMRPMQKGGGVATSCGKYEWKPSVGTQICVAAPCASEIHVMPADSGGPLFLEDVVIGVTFDLFNFNIHKISVFTAVSPHLDWIYNVMKNHNNSV